MVKIMSVDFDRKKMLEQLYSAWLATMQYLNVKSRRKTNNEKG